LSQAAVLRVDAADADDFNWRFYAGEHGSFGEAENASRTIGVKAGESPSVLEPDVAPGYRFAGWSSEVPIQAPRGDRVFVARYEPLPYQWTFDAGEAGTFRFLAQGDELPAGRQEYTVYFAGYFDPSLELQTAAGWNWYDASGNVYGQDGAELYQISHWWIDEVTEQLIEANAPVSANLAKMIADWDAAGNLWVDENGLPPSALVPDDRHFVPLNTTRHVYRYTFYVDTRENWGCGVVIGPDGTEYGVNDEYVVEVPFEGTVPLPEVRPDEGCTFVGWHIPDPAVGVADGAKRHVRCSFVSDPLVWEFYVDGTLCRSIGLPRNAEVPEAVFTFDSALATELLRGRQLLGWDPPIPTDSTGTEPRRVFNAITAPIAYAWTFHAGEHGHFVAEQGQPVSELT
jgi:hypothetical protein